MRYSEIMESVAFRQGDLIVYANPTARQFLGLQARLRLTRYQPSSVRAILYDDVLYVWDAYLAEHTNIADDLGIPIAASTIFEIIGSQVIVNWAENDEASPELQRYQEIIRSARAVQHILGPTFVIKTEYW